MTTQVFNTQKSALSYADEHGLPKEIIRNAGKGKWAIDDVRVKEFRDWQAAQAGTPTAEQSAEQAGSTNPAPIEKEEVEPQQAEEVEVDPIDAEIERALARIKELKAAKAEKEIAAKWTTEFLPAFYEGTRPATELVDELRLILTGTPQDVEYEYLVQVLDAADRGIAECRKVLNGIVKPTKKAGSTKVGPRSSGPTVKEQVQEIFNRLDVDGGQRKEILAACDEAGLNRNSADTQYATIRFEKYGPAAK